MIWRRRKPRSKWEKSPNQNTNLSIFSIGMSYMANQLWVFLWLWVNKELNMCKWCLHHFQGYNRWSIHILSICVFRQESETKITSQGYPVLEKQIYINWLEMNYVSPLHIYLCVQCCLFLILQVLTQCKNIRKSMILFMEASRVLVLCQIIH